MQMCCFYVACEAWSTQRDHDSVGVPLLVSVRLLKNILPTDPPDPLGWGQKVKIQLFQNMVMLHIKKGMTHAATW